VLAATSPYQRIVVTDGRTGHRLFLNGNLQFAERDEYRYHEALVHPAMAAFGAPRRVAVLGGGDGMAVREILKYPSVERVTLVELDPNMTDLFAKDPAMAALNAGALRSPKLRIVNMRTPFSGCRQRHRRAGAVLPEVFDVIVVDFPTPPTFPSASSTPTPFMRCWPSASGQWLRGDPDHLAAGGTPEFLDRGRHHCVGGPARHALPRQRAQLWRMGLHHRQPQTLAHACATTLPLLFEAARRAALSGDGHATPVLQRACLTFQTRTCRACLRDVNRLSNQLLVTTYEQEWGRVGP
jgi:spermidine synthase